MVSYFNQYRELHELMAQIEGKFGPASFAQLKPKIDSLVKQVRSELRTEALKKACEVLRKVIAHENTAEGFGYWVDRLSALNGDLWKQGSQAVIGFYDAGRYFESEKVKAVRLLTSNGAQDGEADQMIAGLPRFQDLKTTRGLQFAGYVLSRLSKGRGPQDFREAFRTLLTVDPKEVSENEDTLIRRTEEKLQFQNAFARFLDLF